MQRRVDGCHHIRLINKLLKIIINSIYFLNLNYLFFKINNDDFEFKFKLGIISYLYLLLRNSY